MRSWPMILEYKISSGSTFVISAWERSHADSFLKKHLIDGETFMEGVEYKRVWGKKDRVTGRWVESVPDVNIHLDADGNPIKHS